MEQHCTRKPQFLDSRTGLGDRVFMLKGSRSALFLGWIFMLWCSPALATPPKPFASTLYIKQPRRKMLQIRTVAHALEQAFTERREVNLTPIRHLLEPLAPLLEHLSEADKAARHGRELLKNLELEKSAVELQRAADLQQRVFHLISTSESGINEHAWLLTDLAVAHFLAGDEKTAREVTQRAMVLNTKLEFDSARFPPQMKRLFDEVRFLVDELGTGGLRVVTRPPGAEVRVNGKFVGFSPAKPTGLTAGPNLVTVSKLGFHTQTLPAKVEGGEIVPLVEAKLKPIASRSVRLLNTALKEATGGSVPKTLQRVSNMLQQRVLFLGTMTSRGGSVEVILYAYDRRRHRVSTRATVTVPAQDPEVGCNEIVAALIPFLQERPRPRPQPAGRKSWLSRFRDSPYFWPVVGAGAVLAVTTLGIGIYYGTRDDPDRGRQLLILPAIRVGGEP
jgi:hypothetical protein